MFKSVSVYQTAMRRTFDCNHTNFRLLPYELLTATIRTFNCNHTLTICSVWHHHLVPLASLSCTSCATILCLLHRRARKRAAVKAAACRLSFTVAKLRNVPSKALAFLFKILAKSFFLHPRGVFFLSRHLENCRWNRCFSRCQTCKKVQESFFMKQKP